MKKSICILLICFLATVILAGCVETGNNSTDISNAASVESSNETPYEASNSSAGIEESSTDIEESTKKVTYILTPEQVIDAIPEVFYEDDEYRYEFPITQSILVIVYYSDGTTQNLPEALESGNITIEDLGRFSIPYARIPKDSSN